MNRERLIHDIKWLESFELPPGHGFNLGTWSCGTTCCAIGWLGTSSPDAKQDGLELYKSPLRVSDLSFGRPIFKRESGWAAVYNYYGAHREDDKSILQEIFTYLPDTSLKEWAQAALAYLENAGLSVGNS